MALIIINSVSIGIQGGTLFLDSFPTYHS